MPPALFQLLSPMTELRHVSPELRSDRYGDAVRRADAGDHLALPRVAFLRRLAVGRVSRHRVTRALAH